MLRGELYHGSDPMLVGMRLRCRQQLQRFHAVDPAHEEVRRRIVQGLFGNIGPGFLIEPRFMCDYGLHIFAGARLYLNFNCIILDCARVDLGDDVFCGPNVQLYTATHPLDSRLRSTGAESARPISIGSRVWIGGGAIVLPGVRIGDDTTIGAGSVVTRDVPAGVLAAGNPARVIRKLDVSAQAP